MGMQAYSVISLYPTLCSPMDCSPPGSSVHGIFQARILEWVTMPSFRGYSWPRDRTHDSYISSLAGRFFTAEPPRSPKEWACIRTNPRATQTLAERSLWEAWPLCEHKRESRRTALGPSVSYTSCRRKPECCIFMTTNEYLLQMRPQSRQAMVRG